MGASVPLSEKLPITNNLCAFIVALVLAQVVGWTDFVWLSLSGSWQLLTHSPCSSPRALYLLFRDTFEWMGNTPSAPRGDKGSVSLVLSVKYIRSGLEASLPAPCKDLRQGCCSVHASSQYHPSISHSNSWILCWLLSSSCKLLKKFVHLGTLAPTTLTSAFRGLPDSGVPSLKLKVWAGLSVLTRSF